MNREIKFKAWDTHRKKMWSAEELGRDQVTLSPDGRGFVNVSGVHTKMSQFLPHLIPLQYTGKKDMNGVEIWEGDICSFTSPMQRQDLSPGVVEWSEAGAYWKLQGKLPVLLHRAVDKKVIGNIHDKPQLLKEQPCA